MGSHLWERLVGRHAVDRVLFYMPDGAVLTRADMIRKAGQYATTLRQAGVGPGDRVAVQVEKSIDMVALYLGCARAGAVFLPLNTAYTPAEVSYFVGDAAPALYVSDPARAVTHGEAALAAGARSFETLGSDGEGSLAIAARTLSGDFVDVERTADDLAAILYTSGTTGRSKGAMLTHGNLASNAETLVDAWKIGSQDVLIHALPIYHTHGLFVAINSVMMAGGAMHFLPKFAPGEVLDLFARSTILMGVPTYYVRLLDQPRLARETLGTMRLFISGSAPLLAETHRQWQHRTGHAILERYGMTETGMNTSNPHDGDRVPGSVGPALPGVAVRVADPESGRILGTDDIGVLEVKGPNVFKGYWRQPEKTAADFREDGWFITGDLARIDPGGYVHIVGRGKDLVISGGLNVYPIEVEAEIDALPGVRESAVIGLPHPDYGEAVTAIVVAEPGAALAEDALVAALEDRLARFKLPKRIAFVDELPRNAMGKVQKAELRTRYASLYADAG